MSQPAQPEPLEASGDESLDELVARAKRAHELIDRVDLGKVVMHDTEELDKVAKVADALEDLCNGEEVTHVPGVDDTDEVPELDPVQIRRSELMEALAAAGYTDRLGRVYFATDDAAEFRPLDLIPHQQGLPEFLLCVAPDFVPTDGAQGVFVAEQGVFVAAVPAPVARHRWRISRSRPYDSEREMIATVRAFMARDQD